MSCSLTILENPHNFLRGLSYFSFVFQRDLQFRSLEVFEHEHKQFQICNLHTVNSLGIMRSSTFFHSTIHSFNNSFIQPLMSISFSHLIFLSWGAWVAQFVKYLPLA